MSNILLVNYSPSESARLVTFFSKKGFHYPFPVCSLGDRLLFSYFEFQSNSKSKIDIVLIDLSPLGSSKRDEINYHGAIKKVHLFLERIREVDSTACVILTGPPIEIELVSDLLRSGVYDYLQTPINLKRLEKRINQGLLNQEQAENIISSMARANQELTEEKAHLQNWNNHLSRIYELNQTLTGSLNLDDLICTFGESLKELVSYDSLSLFLRGNNGPDRAWVWGLSTRVKESEKMTLLKKMQEETIASGNSFLHSSSSLEPVVMREGAEIIVPLFIMEKVIGLMRITKDLGKKKSIPFEPNQTQILSMLTTPLCLALRNAQMYQHLHELAATDELTHILNRRAFLHVLEREFKRSTRLRTSLALLLVDIDSFKAVNDFFGHLTGDLILREVASLLKQSIREIDILARYGGEEFVVILPEGEKDAHLVAERIRSVIEAHFFNKQKNPIRLTVSIGMALLLASRAESTEELFHLADSAVYLAKDRGRNRVEICSLHDKIKESLLQGNGNGNGKH